ncbi:MAG: hypothetical protein ABR591_01930 [Candidatus Velthaea sp.]
MLALFVAVAIASTPGPPCAGADPAVSDIRLKLVKKRGAPDHYVITTTITNAGAQAQTSAITQRAELVQNGMPVAREPLPALGAGVAYIVAFATDRASALRKTPLPVTVRYVLANGDAARNDCNTSNDVLIKVF